MLVVYEDSLCHSFMYPVFVCMFLSGSILLFETKVAIK